MKTELYHPCYMGKRRDDNKEEARRPYIPQGKLERIRIRIHYTSPDWGRKPVIVFGKNKEGLFFNYEDRLIGDDWSAALAHADLVAQKETAAYYEVALNHFHKVTDVDVQCILIECNHSNGFSYIAFGYTYGSMYKSKAAA